jgi:hypothetical protein
MRRESGVDATRTQEQQPLYTRPVRFVDHVCLDLEILSDEITRIGCIRKNATDFGRCQEHVLGTLFAKKLLDLVLVRQIKLLTSAQEQVRIAKRFQPPD